MTIRPPRLLLALVPLAACAGPTEVDDGNGVTSVVVTPANATAKVGETVQFSAQAFNRAGGQVTGQTVTWRSGDPAVATIDGVGLATAVGAGDTEIIATIAGVTNDETLVVEAAECTNRVDVVLAPGEFQTYPGGQCLLLPTGQSGDRYRVAVVKPTLIEDPDDVGDVTLRVDPVLTTAAAPIAVPPQRAPSGAARVPELPAEALRIEAGWTSGALERLDRTREAHRALRERERELTYEVRSVLPDLAGLVPSRTGHPDPPTRADMFLELDCSATPMAKPVIRIAFDDDFVVYQDSVEWDAAPLRAAGAQQLLAYHAAYGKRMITDYVGDVPDTDGNGRVIIVSTSAVPDGATAAVYSGDYLSASSCATSNEGEVVYFTQDVIDTLAAVNPSSSDYVALSTVAHEMKHVVSIYHGVQRGGQFHPSWMEEGRAEIAQTMSSRIAWADKTGPAVGEVITGPDIVADGFTPENYGVVVQVADVVRYLSAQPNSVITDPAGSGSHSFYASSFHFHRFLGDHYGGAATAGADAPLFKQLTALGTPVGAAGLATATGRDYEELFEQLVVATALLGEGVTSAAPVFTTWDFKTAGEIFSVPDPDGVYPWPVTHTGGDPNESPPGDPNWPYATGTFTGPLGPSGIRFHDFLSGGVGQGAQLFVTGVPGGKIIVTRLN